MEAAMRSYRLRRQGTGRRRLDGEPSGEGGWLVTVPELVIAQACRRLDCEPDALRFRVRWDARRQALVYEAEVPRLASM